MQSALFRTKCEGIRLCEAGVVAAVPACFCRLPPVRMRAGRKGWELFSPPVGRADGSPCFRRASIAGSFFSLLAGRSDGSLSLRAVRPVWHTRSYEKAVRDFRGLLLAERTRFELVVRVHPVRRFSKPVVSATHPPLRTTFPGLCAGFPHGARRTHALSKGCANIASFRENAKKTDEISRIRPDRGPSRLLSGVSWLCGASRPTTLRTPRQRVSAPVLQVEIAHVGRFCYLWLRRRYSVSA